YVFWVAVATTVACAVIAAIAAMRGLRPQLAMSLAGTAIAGACAGIPLDLHMRAGAVPRIHDITTDTANPPQFVQLAALRGSEDHATVYAGPRIATQQHRAYPDIGPVMLNAPRAKIFATARDTLVAMGLHIVDADAAQGRIEATASSLLFGFKDDVVV